MKILLLNENPVVSRLVSLSAKKCLMILKNLMLIVKIWVIMM